MLALGDRLIGKHSPLMRGLCRMRGDLFMSDREVAALGFALADAL